MATATESQVVGYGCSGVVSGPLSMAAWWNMRRIVRIVRRLSRKWTLSFESFSRIGLGVGEGKRIGPRRGVSSLSMIENARYYKGYRGSRFDARNGFKFKL